MTMAAVSAALSVLVGAGLGIVYDVIRFVRVLFSVDVKSPFGRKGARRWFSYIFVALGDLFFFAVAAAVLCVFFFLTGDGRMRGYGLVGAYLGFFCYYQTVGRLFIGIVSRLCLLCKRAVKALGRLLLRPICACGRLFREILARFLKTPIVMRMRARYNEYVKQKKEAAVLRKRNKRKKKAVVVRN